MSTQIHKITPETPPVFPCWLWNAESGAIDKTPLGWERWPENPLPYKYSPQRFTHWSEDAPTPPTERPDGIPPEGRTGGLLAEMQEHYAQEEDAKAVTERPTLGGDDNPNRATVATDNTAGYPPPVIPSDPASRAAPNNEAPPFVFPEIKHALHVLRTNKLTMIGTMMFTPTGGKYAFAIPDEYAHQLIAEQYGAESEVTKGFPHCDDATVSVRPGVIKFLAARIARDNEAPPSEAGIAAAVAIYTESTSFDKDEQRLDDRLTDWPATKERAARIIDRAFDAERRAHEQEVGRLKVELEHSDAECTKHTDARLATLERERGPWRIIKTDGTETQWKCSECGGHVSRGPGYPTDNGHLSGCKFSREPVVKRAEEAEGELAALQQSILDLSHPNMKTLLADIAALKSERDGLRADLDWLEAQRHIEIEVSGTVVCLTKGERVPLGEKLMSGATGTRSPDFSFDYPYRFEGGLRAAINQQRAWQAARTASQPEESK